MSEVKQTLMRLSADSFKVGYGAGAKGALRLAVDAANGQRSKFKARDWDDAIDAVVAAIEALGDPPPLPPTTGRQHKY